LHGTRKCDLKLLVLRNWTNFRAFKSPTAKHTRAQREKNIPAAINFTSARATHFSRAPVTPLSKIQMHNEKPSVITPALLSVAHENRFITCVLEPNAPESASTSRKWDSTRRDRERKACADDDGVCFDVGYWDPCSLSVVRGRNFRFSSLRAPALSAWAKKRAANLLHTWCEKRLRATAALIFVSQKFQNMFFCVAVVIFCAAKNS
jgi:hypothetical protein